MDFEFGMNIFFELFLVGVIVTGYKYEPELIEFETILKWYIRKKVRTLWKWLHT